MFGGDVVLRSVEDLARCGLAPYLGRIGLDHRARAVGSLRFRLVAIGTRTPQTARRLCETYRKKLPGATPRPYSGETPWVDIFRDQRVDILYVATPDSLHHAPTMHAVENGAHVVVEKPLTLHTRRSAGDPRTGPRQEARRGRRHAQTLRSLSPLHLRGAGAANRHTALWQGSSRGAARSLDGDLQVGRFLQPLQLRRRALARPLRVLPRSRARLGACRGSKGAACQLGPPRRNEADRHL